MTNCQRNYAIAKALYDTQHKNLSAAIDALPKDAGESAVDTVYDQYPTGLLAQALLDAEQAMVAECYQQVSRHPKIARQFAANRETLDNLFANYHRYPRIREQFVSCCFRLAL